MGIKLSITSPARRYLVGSILLVIALATWIGWLRAPSLAVTMWNVDESIHAAAARTLLEGGVLYKDAVDQRTPLTYYAFAAIFRVAGINNLFAVRVCIVAMITATAFGLFLLGRRTGSVSTGVWSALIFAAFPCHLMYPSDTYAAHTEWFVALFTTAAVVTFMGSTGIPGLARSVAVGALLALAFLSKQPALTDLGAPLGTLIYLAWMRAAPAREILRSGGGILIGFVAVVTPVVFALVAAGAGQDLLFYTWTYNIRYYGPEIGWSERLLSFAPFFEGLAEFYPFLLVLLVISALVLAVRVVQKVYSADQFSNRRNECFLLLWCATSLIGAMSGGRGYYHYYFQCFPPFAWLIGWLLGRASGHLRFRSKSILLASSALVIAAATVSVSWTPLAARHFTFPPPDPALPIAAFIREHSTPQDKIFVWGYNPDIYMYADRAPASRFLYCSFQTGLIPWTNVGPKINTDYAIVPGSMDVLLSELTKNRPKFIVDCSVGPHRRFSKYPLKDFPALDGFVKTNYVELDPATFVLRGFRVFMVRDNQPRRTDAIDGSTLHPAPTLAGPTGDGIFVASAIGAQPALERLAVDVDGRELVGIRFPPSTSAKFQVQIAPSTGSSQKLQAVADWSDGSRTISQELVTSILDGRLTPDQQAAFALPRISGMVSASTVQALASPNASIVNGEHFFNLHAPSSLRYSLPIGALAVRGRFGIQPGAYSSDNPTPTDGAVFIVRTTTPAGRSNILLEKWLRPGIEPSHRGAQNFHIDLESVADGSVLEFEISSGPDANPASDWTYWSDLMLEVSP